MRNGSFVGIVTMVFVLSLTACGSDSTSGQSADPELRQALAFVRYLASPRFRRKSAFTQIPEQIPSRFVGYLFSDMGAAEWMMTGDPFEAEQLKSIGVPVPPQNVVIHYARQPDAVKQLILHGDDEAGVINVQGFVPGNPLPVLEVEIPFRP